MKIILNDEVYIVNGSNNVHPNDNFEYQCDEYGVGVQGIVLNAKRFEHADVVENIVGGFTQRHYKGSYVMWYYDKVNEVIYVANDLLSKQSVYYYAQDGLVFVNTSLFDLCSDIRVNGRVPSVNMDAIKYFCDNNVFYGDVTYEKNTHFLTAYSYLVIDCRKKTIKVEKIPMPKMISEKNVDTNNIVDNLEKLFSEGCALEWQKNVEYGKDQVFTLSGGMDSRATLLHLIEKDEREKIRTYTYAQSGSDDAIISEKFAGKLQVSHTFIPLDDCKFAYLRDEIISANEGQMYYIGSTGAILMAKLCIQQYSPGIVHTGLGGGEILGDICVADGDRYVTANADVTINQQHNIDDIRRCLNFQKTTSKYFSVFSPFLYEDFFEFVMTLPASLKRHRKIYIEWYKRHMGSDFPSAKSYSLFAKVFNRLKLKVYKALRKRNPADMNPLQYWYDTKPELRQFLDDTWENDKVLLKEHDVLIAVLDKNFKQNINHKFAVLTASKSVIEILGLNKI